MSATSLSFCENNVTIENKTVLEESKINNIGV